MSEPTDRDHKATGEADPTGERNWPPPHDIRRRAREITSQPASLILSPPAPRRRGSLAVSGADRGPCPLSVLEVATSFFPSPFRQVAQSLETRGPLRPYPGPVRSV